MKNSVKEKYADGNVYLFQSRIIATIDFIEDG